MDAFDEIEQIYDTHFGITDRQENRQDIENRAETDFEHRENEDGVENDIIEEFLTINSVVLAANEDATVESYEQITSRLACACGKNCLALFSEQEVREHVFNLRELEKAEKEFYIMGVLHRLGCGQNYNNEVKRKRIRYVFKHSEICKDAFCLLFDIGNFTLRALMTHINKHGLVRREHGNKGKRAIHAVSYEDILRVVNFIRNKGEEVGLPMPAAPRGSDGQPPTYLPASCTKMALHAEYVACCAEQDARVLKYSTFTETWRSCCPTIKIASPRDDVCSKCEGFRKLIMDARTECDKMSACAGFSQHIETAMKERELYRDWVKNAQNEDINNTHYTFDFAQLVTVPHHGRQMGPLYFVTPRRIHVFGFRLDGTPRQVNYLIDESNTTGVDGKGIHGPNAVISMLDDGLEKFSFGEDECGFHADNCFGQNKNWYVLAYMAWRVLVGLHTKITYMMQIPGHTKCLVDAGFASAKRLYRRTDADTVSQVAELFTKSSATNEALLYKDPGSSDVNWEWRDWKEFLARNFKPLKGISKYHYFQFSSQYPGQVLAREAADGPDCFHTLLKDPEHQFDRISVEKPEPVPAAGLSAERQRYLFKHVRPHVREQYRDITCPAPTEE